MGAERYRGRTSGEHRTAGVRTFAFFCLLGAVCGILATTAFTTVTFAALALLVVAGYLRSPGGSIGLTTEIAALLVFWIGCLLSVQEAAAVSLGVVLTIFLASKHELHRFVREKISEVEFEATLKFLAVVLVIYPVLPDRSLGPYAFFNPREVWGFVILVSTISYAGYFLVRWLGPRRGLLLGSLAGGLVSGTATTLTLAQRARETPGASRLLGVQAVLANAVQGPRLLLLIWVADRQLAAHLAGPLVGMAAVGLLGSWVLSRGLDTARDIDLPLRNPFSVIPALRFGLYFVAILLVTATTKAELGNPGILVASAISGLASTSAVALSVSRAVAQSSLPPLVASTAILGAVVTSALAKCVLSLVYGTPRMTLWLAGGLGTMLATGFALLFTLPATP